MAVPHEANIRKKGKWKNRSRRLYISFQEINREKGSVDIPFKDDVTVILLLGVSFMLFPQYLV
jgi:hypothetical protein